jgi:hypothetical protein
MFWGRSPSLKAIGVLAHLSGYRDSGSTATAVTCLFRTLTVLRDAMLSTLLCITKNGALSSVKLLSIVFTIIVIEGVSRELGISLCILLPLVLFCWGFSRL